MGRLVMGVMTCFIILLGCWELNPSIFQDKPRAQVLYIEIFCRGTQIRTGGLTVPNDARYQLRHTPIKYFMCERRVLPIHYTPKMCPRAELYRTQEIIYLLQTTRGSTCLFIQSYSKCRKSEEELFCLFRSLDRRYSNLFLHSWGCWARSLTCFKQSGIV